MTIESSAIRKCHNKDGFHHARNVTRRDRPSGVNFTNILWAAFTPIVFHKCQKTLMTWLNFYTFGILLAAFRMKVFFAALRCLQFGFVIFCQKSIGAKAARKILMTLSTGSLRHEGPRSPQTWTSNTSQWNEDQRGAFLNKLFICRLWKKARPFEILQNVLAFWLFYLKKVVIDFRFRHPPMPSPLLRQWVIKKRVQCWNDQSKWLTSVSARLRSWPLYPDISKLWRLKNRS